MSQALVVAALVAATVAGDSNYGYAKEPRLSLVDENRKAVVAGADATAWCPGTPWPAPAAGEGRQVVLVLRGEIYRSEATTRPPARDRLGRLGSRRGSRDNVRAAASTRRLAPDRRQSRGVDAKKRAGTASPATHQKSPRRVRPKTGSSPSSRPRVTSSRASSSRSRPAASRLIFSPRPAIRAAPGKTTSTQSSPGRRDDA